MLAAAAVSRQMNHIDTGQFVWIVVSNVKGFGKVRKEKQTWRLIASVSWGVCGSGAHKNFGCLVNEIYH